MRICKPEIVKDKEYVQVRSLIETNSGNKYLWYSVPSEYSSFLVTECLDGFLVALLPHAMFLSEDIILEAPVSEKLFYNLTNYYIEIFNLMVPSSPGIKIKPNGLFSKKYIQPLSGVATGFSGGIDSLSVLNDHYFDCELESYRVTHLLFNNVGSHGRGGYSLFKDRYLKLYPFAKKYNLPFLSINTNLDEFKNYNFELTHTTRNVSVALILQKLFSKYLYASGLKYSDCFLGKTSDSAFQDPVVLPLLSTESIECISSGSQYSRVDKTIVVSKIESTYSCLDVCVDPYVDGNCSKCFKCLRTLFTLDIIGKAEKYKDIFDLKVYQKVKNKYIARVLYSKDPFSKEIKILIKGFRYRVNFKARILGFVFWISSIFSNGIRRLIRSFPKSLKNIVVRCMQ